MMILGFLLLLDRSSLISLHNVHLEAYYKEALLDEDNTVKSIAKFCVHLKFKTQNHVYAYIIHFSTVSTYL